jgi:N-acetylmuramic acid 6-phosphate (MurNAc-6-P) etherase
MIKTKADLAKLTARQREVLTAIARQVSKEKASQFLDVAEATTKIDAVALLRAYTAVQEVLSILESSSAPSISPTLASLAEEWQTLLLNEKNTKRSGGPEKNSR